MAYPRYHSPVAVQGGIVTRAALSQDGALVLEIERDGFVYHLESWRDPEGNGPGFMWCDRRKARVKKARVDDIEQAHRDATVEAWARDMTPAQREATEQAWRDERDDVRE